MRSADSLRTISTRQLHYLKFATDMRWDDDLLLENLPEANAVRGQLQLSMYAVHLSTGHSIYCKQIKAKTVETYVYNAASFLSLFSGRDFRKDRPEDKHMGHLLSSVYRDLQAYESVPKRREPYTLQMHAIAAQEAAPRRAKDVASLIPVLTNGFGAGINAGLRRSEWAQPSGYRDPLRPLLNHMKVGILTKAFVPVDLEAHTSTNDRLVGLAILTVSHIQIVRLFVVWRTQKNGQHGEKRLFTLSDHPNSPHDPIFCFYGLLLSFRECQRRDPRLQEDATPLSVYWDPELSCVRLVTSDEIDAYIRALASRTYNLDPKEKKAELQRWSGHSLRVGACVLLHSMGFQPQDIKWILRWLSDAFVAYLRNTVALATRHTRALDKAATMPHYV